MSRNVHKAQPAGYEAFFATAHMDEGAAVAHELNLERIVLGAILCNGLQPLADASLDLRADDFSNPDHGKTLEWLHQNRDRWRHGFDNLIDIHSQLDKAGLAARLGQGSAGVLELMNVGAEIGRELLKHRARELIDASIERHRRKLASDFAARRIDFADYSARLAELAKREGEKLGGLPPFLSLADLDYEYSKEPQLLVAGSSAEDEKDGALLARGEVLVLGSASKVGKTWMGIDLALSIAAGRNWLDHFICKRGRVLYVNMELGGYAFARRIEMMLQKRGIKVSEVSDRIAVWQLRNTRIAAIEELGDLIAMRGEGFDLIILDPLYQLLGDREENSNGDMAALMQAIQERFCNGDKTAVALIHHFPKGDMSKRSSLDRFAGAGAIARAADALVTITPEGETYRLEYTTRNYKAGSALELRVEFPTVDVHGIAEAMSPKAKAAANHEILREIIREESSLTKADLVQRFMQETGVAKSMAYKAIKAAEKSNAIERTKLEKTYVAL
jgi:hypothetical protein